MRTDDEAAPELHSPTIEARRAQAFPARSEDEIARMKRFGAVRHFKEGDKLFEIGKPSGGMHVLCSGHVRITGRDSHGQELKVTDHGPGSFTGELGQLTSRRSFVDGTGDVRAGSVKRVGAAIGEGAAVVAQIHEHLAALAEGLDRVPAG